VKAKVHPISGKHYGTYVSVEIDGQEYGVEVWIPHGPPSTEERGHWEGEPDICDQHYQSEVEARIANLLADAINGTNPKVPAGEDG
jgi:hypothetical protein